MNELITDEAFVEIGPLIPSERPRAVGVLARGMGDSPMHVAVFGHESPAQRSVVRRFYERAMPWTEWQTLVARDGEGTIIGVMALAAPDACGLLAEKVGGFCTVLRHLPEAVRRAAEWLSVWRDRDPLERHWHLGALTVDLPLRGRGIRSQLLRVLAAQMDAGKGCVYVETDDAGSARLYERFGFEVMGEQAVMGVPTWFMMRHLAPLPEAKEV
jgi:ribosomal protein S18 acetylase RimI-like enzyme